LENKWRDVFDRFSQYCDIPIETIPVVHIRYGEDKVYVYSKIAYAILIAQYGIGRIMFSGHWVVATKSDDFSDIISRIRGILSSNYLIFDNKYMDMIHEASEVSGYENPNILMI
jgi:hypothetical protein